MKVNIIAELKTLIITQACEEVDDKFHYKYLNINEFLICFLCLNERLTNNQSRLARLHLFLNHKSSLHSLLASLFSKAIGIII